MRFGFLVFSFFLVQIVSANFPFEILELDLWVLDRKLRVMGHRFAHLQRLNFTKFERVPLPYIQQVSKL